MIAFQHACSLVDVGGGGICVATVVQSCECVPRGNMTVYTVCFKTSVFSPLVKTKT